MMRALVVGALVVAVSVAACAQRDGPERSQAGALAIESPGCTALIYGGKGRPDFVIGASTALQGVPAAQGVQEAQALKLVFEQRDWRAGAFSVGLQICDEMTASREISSPAKCRRNALRFANNRSVLGVVGVKHSECALEMLPLLNRAPDGPLVLVGASTTYLGLTRLGPGAGAPDSNFPTGRRSFVRVLPADDVQGAAGALFAKREGARRVFVLNDCCAYGFGVAKAFRLTAERIGLSVVGTGLWVPGTRTYRTLAERIRSARADTVYLGGYLESNGLRLIRSLRATLGQDVELLAPDGFHSPAALVEGAGAAAEGFAWTIATLPNNDLPAAGREFAAEFEERFSQRPCCYTVQTAQAGHILLDAIARSDGSRPDVTKNVLDTRVEDGLLGDFEFDRYGDTTLNTTAVYRIVDGQPRFQTAIRVPAEVLARR